MNWSSGSAYLVGFPFSGLVVRATDPMSSERVIDVRRFASLGLILSLFHLTTSQAFGGLLASALLNIKQLDGLPFGRWRNICGSHSSRVRSLPNLASVLVEGSITMFLALCGYFLLPGPKERTKFLTEREREIAIGRLASESVIVSAKKSELRSPLILCLLGRSDF